MIVEDMRNTGRLGVPEEWFIPWVPNGAQRDWKAHWKGVVKKATGSNGVMAIKVMADQLAPVETCLKSVLSPVPGPRFFRFHKIFEDAVWVWIKRNDVVAQAVSRVMARQTGINHATDGQNHFVGNLLKGGDQESYNKNAVYSREEIEIQCTSIVIENVVWERFFNDFEIKPIVLNYENFSKDESLSHLDLIQNAVGLDEDLQKKPRLIKKLANKKSENFYSSFFRDVTSEGYFKLDRTRHSK